MTGLSPARLVRLRLAHEELRTKHHANLKQIIYHANREGRFAYAEKLYTSHIASIDQICHSLELKGPLSLQTLALIHDNQYRHELAVRAFNKAYNDNHRVEPDTAALISKAENIHQLITEHNICYDQALVLLDHPNIQVTPRMMSREVILKQKDVLCFSFYKPGHNRLRHKTRFNEYPPIMFNAINQFNLEKIEELIVDAKFGINESIITSDHCDTVECNILSYALFQAIELESYTTLNEPVRIIQFLLDNGADPDASVSREDLARVRSTKSLRDTCAIALDHLSHGGHLIGPAHLKQQMCMQLCQLIVEARPINTASARCAFLKRNGV